MDKQELLLLSNDRPAAENILCQLFGIPHFYDEQWEAIRCLLRGERILMIQRTGFGKSLCFQFPAVLFDGVTVVFSPLIALMRDQVRSLQSRGIEARCVNSEQTPEENIQAINDAMAGKVKILYIAPERQESQQWIESTRRMRLSMVVVDEAHTISVWGHDFRPSFRRIVNLVNLLPTGFPVLAATATATKTVQADIERQIGNGITTLRGNLMRHNFKIHVVKVNSEEEKMAWLDENLRSLPGTGLLYTGTRMDTDLYSRWLRFCGYEVAEYNAGLDPESRREIEHGLKVNRWKCIVSTNALGMGIDKPDIRFVIHTQIPASPIHYYQEIGRAGRDGKETHIVLLYNGSISAKGVPEDELLPRAFIESARPSEAKYREVIELLKNDVLGEKQIIMAANLKMTQARTIREDLIEQGLIREVYLDGRKKFEYQFGAPELDFTRFQQLKEMKLRELAAMTGYVHTARPRMEYLCGYLGDSFSGPLTGCDNTTEPIWRIDLSEEMAAKIRSFREASFPVLPLVDPKIKMVNGVAGSYYGVTSVGSVIHRCKYENGGDYPDNLLRLVLKAYRKEFGNVRPDIVMFVPPTKSGNLVENFAAKVAYVLKSPLSTGLVKTRQTEPQKIFHSAYSKKGNVSKAFALENVDVKGKSVLLIDDIFDSGATLKEIGKLLSAEGASLIMPLVIAKTKGNDNI